MSETHHLSPAELADQLDAFLCGKSETLTHELLGKFEYEIRKVAKAPTKVLALPFDSLILYQFNVINYIYARLFYTTIEPLRRRHCSRR